MEEKLNMCRGTYIFPSNTKNQQSDLQMYMGRNQHRNAQCINNRPTNHERKRNATDTNLLRNGESVASQNSSDEVANIRVYLVGEKIWVLVL